MSNYNSNLQTNNTSLQAILDTINDLPEANGSEQATPVITIDSNGLITATAGDKSATRQLATQAAKTITPKFSSQIAVARDMYTTGAVIVAGDTNLVANNIKKNTTIFGVTGTYEGSCADTSDATATADEIFAGETAYGADGKVTGTFTIDNELADEGNLLRQLQNALKGKIIPPSEPSAATFKKDVNFYDYDGTLLYSYTVEEAQRLIELPGLPSQPGLICQGWNYDLETIKSYNRAVDVGATYITDDGKTRLYIKIAAEGRMTVPLYFSQTVSNGAVINWGDGTPTETLSGTGNKNISHTYTSIGDYVISLEVTSGTMGLGNNSSSYCVMGSTGNTGIVYCNMLQKVEIGHGVTSISSWAFYRCYSLVNVVIPNSIASIDNHAFYFCHSLVSVVIPNSVTSIGDSTFGDCPSLVSVVIPNSVTSIGDSTFASCRSLASVVIPNSVISISYGMFSNCHSLSSIVLPNSVTRIADNAFSYCRSLASIIIPNGVTGIDSSAFDSCISLASIVIPGSVTVIDNGAFVDCYGMAIYDFTSHTSKPTLYNTNVFSNNPSDCIIKVPASLYDEWIAATNWSTYASQIVAV